MAETKTTIIKWISYATIDIMEGNFASAKTSLEYALNDLEVLLCNNG